MTSSFIKKAKSLGFVSIGFSRPDRPLFFDKFCEWIAAGRQGKMNWIRKNLDLRENPGKLLKDCQTVISLAFPYASIRPCTPDGFTTARYTEPNKIDYHDRLRKLAQILARGIARQFPGSKTRVCVDSAPILERSFAYASGMGFIGKNNTFIIPGYGSYIFLAEILTTVLIPLLKSNPMEIGCGSCTRCVDACPTGALGSPFSLDASKCLSYLTVEDRGEIDREAGRRMGNCFFGCDVCQEVCPFNEGEKSRDLLLPSTDEILWMGEKDFKMRFGDSTFGRAGLKKIKSNIKAVRSIFEE